MEAKRRNPMVVSLSDLPPNLLEGGRFAHFSTTKVPIPTGSKELDTILAGGWPRHEISYIQGESGSGKSALCEETALNFINNGGDAVFIFCLSGDHPLLGFEGRLYHTNRIFIVNRLDLTESFNMLDRTMNLNPELDVLAIFDDLSSLTPEHKTAVKKVMQGLSGMRKFLKRNLSILLVNQVRDMDKGSVGATAYNKIFNQAAAAVHLGPQDYIHEGEDIVGFKSDCIVLTPVQQQGTQFQMFLRYGTGVVG